MMINLLCKCKLKDTKYCRHCPCKLQIYKELISLQKASDISLGKLWEECFNITYYS